MSAQTSSEQVTAVNMQSADNWYTLDQIVNTPATAPATRYLDTQVASNEIVNLSPAPSGNYGYLNGTQDVATNQPITSQYNCGDYFCYTDAYAGANK